MASVVSIAKELSRKQPAPQPALHEMFADMTAKKTVRFEDIEEALLVRALSAWTDAGYAITFGRTSDGGAISMSLLAGDYRKKLYAADAEELADALARIGNVKG